MLTCSLSYTYNYISATLLITSNLRVYPHLLCRFSDVASRLSSSGVPSHKFYHNIYSACTVIVVIFGHLKNRSFYLLTNDFLIQFVMFLLQTLLVVAEYQLRKYRIYVNEVNNSDADQNSFSANKLKIIGFSWDLYVPFLHISICTTSFFAVFYSSLVFFLSSLASLCPFTTTNLFFWHLFQDNPDELVLDLSKKFVFHYHDGQVWLCQ